jgi:chemotaxis response regulator CheB
MTASISLAVPTTRRAIVIGASTGGVEALHIVLASLPPDCPPVFVVQHMRPNFMESFVAGLNRSCQARVELAGDLTMARAGHIYIAPPGERHLVLSANGGLKTRLVFGPPIEGHRPSVHRLFQSAAALTRPPAAALLTGMGRDGAEGLLLLHNAGAPTIAQDEASSVVFGMPKAAIELKAAKQVLPLPLIGAALLAAAGRETNNTREET